MELGQQRRHLDNRLSRGRAFQKDDSIIARNLQAPALPATLTGRDNRIYSQPACTPGSHNLEVVVHPAAFLEYFWSLCVYLGSVTQGMKASPSPL